MADVLHRSCIVVVEEAKCRPLVPRLGPVGLQLEDLAQQRVGDIVPVGVDGRDDARHEKVGCIRTGLHPDLFDEPRDALRFVGVGRLGEPPEELIQNLGTGRGFLRRFRLRRRIGLARHGRQRPRGAVEPENRMRGHGSRSGDVRSGDLWPVAEKLRRKLLIRLRIVGRQGQGGARRRQGQRGRARQEQGRERNSLEIKIPHRLKIGRAWRSVKARSAAGCARTPVPTIPRFLRQPR